MIYAARILPVSEDMFAFGDLQAFSKYALLGQREPRGVPVLVEHDPSVELGRVTRTYAEAGWLVAEFELRPSAAAAWARDVVRVGTPVSAGYEPLRWRTIADTIRLHELIRLEEVSILSSTRPAYRGAEVIRVLDGSPRRARRQKVASVEPPAIALRSGTTHRRAGLGEILELR
jgi:phage head maturation protease